MPYPFVSPGLGGTLWDKSLAQGLNTMIGQFQITVSVRIVCMKRNSGRIWVLIMPYQSL